IDGYIISHNDEYQNEYTPECFKRLEYVTGFTGSSGMAVITKDGQYFWTDGRYRIQAQKEVPEYKICERDFREVGNLRIGYNPYLFTKVGLAALSKDMVLIPTAVDLVDEIWNERPKASSKAAYLYPVEYAGMSSEEKLAKVRKEFLGKAKYLLITEPDSICWLLNIRGNDIEYVAVLLSYMILSENDAICFTDLSKIPSDVIAALSHVRFREADELQDTLRLIADPIIIDPASCALGFADLISNKIESQNPCLVLKACKDEVEINYAKERHIKDAVALCEGFAWVQNNPGITEHEVSVKLTELRGKQEGYVMDSFPTIAGFRDNGAIIHYRPPENGSKKIEGDGLLLIDSGAHYFGCTTDVTRVLVFGVPTEEQKKRYTQVLKGHLALAMAVVPEGAIGGSLDSLARMHLWKDGVDYAHGTGHGVGNMLSVHEYPRSIWTPQAAMQLRQGYIISDEPGYYKDGEFGIRIENLMFVKRSSKKGFLEFEMLTLVPYEKALIDFDMLTKDELDYLGSYNNSIKERVYPLLSDKAKVWVQAQMG
ncbi:MAG: aminopeptidase P family protein, partial [Bacteroidetes bacterium]|nr:aminopeptidase P family protein [Bacteroidota bacterium]